MNSQIKDRYDAELVAAGEYSNQFPDTPRILFNAAEKLAEMIEKAPGRNRRIKSRYVFETIAKGGMEDLTMSDNPILRWAAYQRADDKVSYLHAKKQRIRFSTGENNLANYNSQALFGDACWEAFRKYMGWHTPVPWDELFYHKCVEDFQFRRGDRSVAMKKSSLNRADPDYQIMITLKQQLKMKDGDNTKAKAPQPIWVHPDWQLFAEGPYGIYLLEMVLKHKPPWWHFHAKQTYEQFEGWVSTYLADTEIYEMSDQTGQDQAAQGWAVRVFENLMLWFSFPQHVVDQFKQFKLFKVAQGHIVAIMTDSGEVWTFLINTISSTARECLMYDIRPGHPMANGGDDTLRAPIVTVSVNYAPFANIDPCADKRYTSKRGDFTSHCIVKGVLFKNPQLLLARFVNKVASGRGQESVLGYAEMFKRNYDLKELLVDLLTEEEMDAHNIMTRIMFNLRREGLKAPKSWEKYNLIELQEIPKLENSDFKMLDTVRAFASHINGIVENEGMINNAFQDYNVMAYTAML